MNLVKSFAESLTQKWIRLGSTLGVLLVVGFVIGAPIRQVAIDYLLYLRVQDGLLSKTPQGKLYIDLYYAHLDEIIRLVQADSGLLREGLSVLSLWEPNLRALLDGKGGQVTIKRQQVQAVTKFLDHLSAKASPELRQTISDERARTPLEPLVGLSMDKAYETVIGYPPTFEIPPRPTPVAAYTLTWLPPLSTVVDNRVGKGQTIPIEFTSQDAYGHPLVDPPVALAIQDSDGVVIWKQANPFRAKQYRYDLDTGGMADKCYTLWVFLDANDPASDLAPQIWLCLGNGRSSELHARSTRLSPLHEPVTCPLLHLV
jgi:hypothetical protein